MNLLFMLICKHKYLKIERANYLYEQTKCIGNKDSTNSPI